MATYEATKAYQSTSSQPDKIHWSTEASYRNSAYRQLHHQRGLIGTFQVRLLEAADLKRSYWSALALGPVKHLGLSKAHGPISSYATFVLGFRGGLVADESAGGRRERGVSERSLGSHREDADSDRKAGSGGRGLTASSSFPSLASSTSFRRAASSLSISDDNNDDDGGAGAGGDDDHDGDDNRQHPNDNSAHGSRTSSTRSLNRHMADHDDTATTTTSASSSPSSSHSQFYFNPRGPTYRSSVIPRNDNPIWTSGEKCKFDIPLRKGAMKYDGMRVVLSVRLDEEMTAAEAFVPGGVVGGGGGSVGGGRSADGTGRMIGMGEVDITSLCLGEDYVEYSNDDDCDAADRGSVGVLDVWVTLRHPSASASALAASSSSVTTASASRATASAVAASSLPAKPNDPFDISMKSATSKLSSTTANSSSSLSHDKNDNSTGRVRVLISYEPHGLHPHRNDIVAFECFARRSNRRNTCYPILPPLRPMRVLDTRGSYVHVQYDMSPHFSTNHSQRDARRRRRGNERKRKQRHHAGTMRLHRNAVFVIERTNLMDDAVNLAMLPADVILSTPLGRGTVDLVGPFVEAASDLVMPAVLSGKLLFAAARTGVGATWMGMSAATAAVVQAQNPNNRRRPYGRGLSSASSSSVGGGSDGERGVGGGGGGGGGGDDGQWEEHFV